jgi:RNA polymerase sigma-70 factor (ECF subfamily)
VEGPGTDPLLPGLAAGDQRAFAALYDRLAGRLYGVARVMLNHPEDAEDAVHEVFVSLVRSRAVLGEVRDLEAYTFAALRRAAGRLATRRARHPVASQQAVEEAATADGPSEHDDPDDDRLRQALRALPPEQREVIALRIDGGLTFRQIAQAMDTSINTAASRYRYALEHLRRILGGKGWRKSEANPDG